MFNSKSFKIIILAAFSAGVGLQMESRLSAQETSISLAQDFRRLKTIEFPVDAPYSPQVATLGKMLFFDPRLSRVT